MKKRLAYLATALILGATTAAGGMGTVSAVFAEDLKVIGEETGDTLEVKVKNSTGKEIKGIAFYSEEKEEFGENLLKDGDVLAADEQRVLYYLPSDSDEEIPAYVIRLTFADDKTVTLHEVKLSDASEDGFALCATGDGIGYVSYKSVSEGKDVDTKRVELAYLSYDDVSTGNGEDSEAGGMFEECMNDGLMD